MTRITAGELMLTNFVTIGMQQTLGEALRSLLVLQGKPAVPSALLVLNEDGDYRGLLTARLLVRGLLSIWMPDRKVRGNEEQLQAALLDVVKDRLRVPVRDALIRGIPVVDRRARLLPLISACTDQRLEFVPVVEEEKALGLVPVTALFRATASLALTPDDEGIRLDQRG